jgi:hypothetical protein
MYSVLQKLQFSFTVYCTKYAFSKPHTKHHTAVLGRTFPYVLYEDQSTTQTGSINLYGYAPMGAAPVAPRPPPPARRRVRGCQGAVAEARCEWLRVAGARRGGAEPQRRQLRWAGRLRCRSATVNTCWIQARLQRGQREQREDYLPGGRTDSHP